QVLRQLSGNDMKKIDFYFHPEGSLANTYKTQGSDIGLAAGLIGMDITDPEMPDSLEKISARGVELSFHITDYPANHPNTYRCTIINSNDEVIHATALSTGGGLIEFVEFQGYKCSVKMDLPTLIIQGRSDEINQWWNKANTDPEFKSQIYRHQIDNQGNESMLIIEFNTDNPIVKNIDLRECKSTLINPVYPVIGYAGSTLPFRTAGDLENMHNLLQQDLATLATNYESKRSGISVEDVKKRMNELVDIFMESIDTGLSGTEYKDRLVHAQSPEFMKSAHQGKLLNAGPLDKMTAYTMAIMESKSAMEVIIAAPTAGAAGGLPGALIGMAEDMSANRKQVVNAFLAAGLIGVFISKEATFAAEVAGCQAETGSGASMAAAGMIQLAGGNAQQALGAASIALQNVMGLICDPVANRVEIPCLSRNVQAGANALISANMVLGGVDPVIPLSETIKSMLDVGKALPREFRCTALGGLSVTPTAKELGNSII
ncbi:MAG: L-serine ammonia-lyase, iron-sulfur-dependent, subunit alpha, partial [Bacteroidales bacterium]|nr:L-serine ammonia-lyase, iron-sulfur-dependent, subunit alpha [Bacteroidales bacterium]